MALTKNTNQTKKYYMPLLGSGIVGLVMAEIGHMIIGNKLSGYDIFYFLLPLSLMFFSFLIIYLSNDDEVKIWHSQKN